MIEASVVKPTTRVQFLGAEYRILWAVGLLLGFGMIMTVNLAYHSNTEALDKSYFIALLKFFASAIIGLGLMYAQRWLSSKAIFVFASILLLVSLALLIYTWQHGVIVHGARRWIDIFGFRFQPVELFKPVLAVSLASILCLNELGYKSRIAILVTQLIFVIITGASLVLIFLQPNHSAVVICLMAIFFLALLSNSIKWKYICGIMFVVIIATAVMLLGSEEKRERIEAWIFGKNSDDISLKAERYQVELALKAIAAGGWTGQGLGRSVVKYSLPASSTDFV
ncbi:FtsW/RodA/SpoVE family cell cycle protein, partial [bacterium]|nr:FtsW/RodA/SpoVE family cell cycle protein [bacterium]MBU1025316.1 FtsW/RodA/SpoVE family cell cycle protein [bacterium]